MFLLCFNQCHYTTKNTTDGTEGGEKTNVVGDVASVQRSNPRDKRQITVSVHVEKGALFSHSQLKSYTPTCLRCPTVHDVLLLKRSEPFVVLFCSLLCFFEDGADCGDDGGFGAAGCGCYGDDGRQGGSGGDECGLG